MLRAILHGLRADAGELRRLVVATGRQLARPPSGRGWAAGAGVAAAAAGAYADKRPIAALFAQHGGGLATRLAEIINVAGGGAAIVTLGLLGLLVGRALGRDALVQAALVLGAAGLWCWLFTRTGQLVLAERRPIEGGAMRWFALGGHGISGHASGAALLLAPLRDVLGRGAARSRLRLITAATAGAALIIGWSRMWLGMHFLWNVVLGLAIGLACGRAAVAAWRDLARRPP